MTNERVIAMGMAAALCACRLSAQGPLTPPGAPGVTMKTLQQIEPRTPISSAPYVITAPGAYYLTTNLVSAGHGIVVQAPNVTLDLMGFTVSGDGESGDYGIYLQGSAEVPLSGVTVCNGRVEGFHFGLYAAYLSHSRLEALQVTRNTAAGMLFSGVGGSACSGNRITACTLSRNATFGLYVQCQSGGSIQGNVIADCEMADNSNVGLRLYNATGGSHGENRVERCVLRNNLSSGIMMTAVSNTVIEACTVSGQAGRGIEMELSNHNTGMGCLIVKNTGSAGILVSQGKGNRIEGNRVIDNGGQSDRGIWTSISEKNLIVRNICIGQASNYDLDTDDTYGPIVTDTGELSAGTAAAHPWANFSRP